MNGAGFDWLNIAGLSSDSNLPPPPVSFGVTPTSSTSSVDLVSKNGLQHQNQQKNEPSQPPPLAPKSQSEDNLATQPAYVETEADVSVPLSLTVDQLTKDEAKTYLRWYNDIVVRRSTKLIKLHDVFKFLSNFKLSTHVRDVLERIFRSCVTLNIGEFFALLRLISHAILEQRIPSRRLITHPAPIPKPKSILSRKRMNDVVNDDNDDNDTNASLTITPNNTEGPDASKFDLDSFTQFILTGHRPGDESPRRKKKNAVSKRVKFSDEVSVEPSAEAAAPVNLDLTLPMDQLLGRFPKPQPGPEKHINEDEELKEMQDSFNHFKNIKNVDSALIHGTPANIPSIFFDNEMATNNNSPRVASPDPSSQVRLLSPNHTGPVNAQGLLPPNHTGPGTNPNLLQPMSTGGGDQFLNSLLSPNSAEQRPISPSNGYLSPNYTGQTNQVPLQPAMTGSLSSAMRDNFGNQRVSSASPSFGNNGNTNSDSLHVPAPPQSRQRSASSPISFDPNSMNVANQQAPQNRVPSPLASSRSPPPPPPPRARASTVTQAPQPPPSRNSQPGPALPPKIPVNSSSPSYYQQPSFEERNNHPYAHNNDSSSSSTADILGDLKALQSEVDRLQYYQR